MCWIKTREGIAQKASTQGAKLGGVVMSMACGWSELELRPDQSQAFGVEHHLVIEKGVGVKALAVSRVGYWEAEIRRNQWNLERLAWRSPLLSQT